MRPIISLIAAIIFGAVVGAVMVLLDKIGFYLIVVVPVIGGAIIGFGVALPYLNRASSARTVSSGIGTGLSSAVVMDIDDRPSRIPLIIVALIGVLVAQAVYWGGSYIVVLLDEYSGYQTEIVRIVKEQNPSMTDEAALAQVSELETEMTGTTGFPAFLKLSMEDETTNFAAFVEFSAEQGMSINRATSSSDSGLVLQGPLAYGFWVIEALAMWFLACTTALSRARPAPTPEVAPAAS